MHSTRLKLLIIFAGIFALTAQTVHAASPTPERNFYDVLEDVLGDFDLDLKNGNVTGLKDISIKNIALSENVPQSFKSHLELLLTERILKNTKAQVIQCLPCKAKKSTMTGDQVVISSNDTNPIEIARIAKTGGIAHFLDAAFTYQPMGIVLSMTITQPETGAIVWSRSYNSETSRAQAVRRGVDITQSDDARKVTEYTPSIQYRGTIYYMYQPNVGATSGCVGAGGRMVERYDNRKKEVGFEVNYFKDSTSLVGATTTSTDNLWTGLNLTILFVHAWNFIGEEENFNKIRGSLVLGLGGTYSTGYLGGIARAGWEWRLAKHFAVSTSAGYRPASTAFIGTNTTTGTAVSGIEAGLGISFLIN